MPPLEPLTLSEVSQRFKKSDVFYFEKYEDGFFTFFANTEPFPQSITFYPSPYAYLKQPCTIDDLTAAIDTNKHFGITIIFG